MSNGFTDEDLDIALANMELAAKNLAMNAEGVWNGAYDRRRWRETVVPLIAGDVTTDAGGIKELVQSFFKAADRARVVIEGHAKTPRTDDNGQRNPGEPNDVRRQA
jgi:hypothetical protein